MSDRVCVSVGWKVRVSALTRVIHGELNKKSKDPHCCFTQCTAFTVKGALCSFRDRSSLTDCFLPKQTK